MQIKRLLFFFLVTGSFLNGSLARAHGVADSLLYRQVKLRIWCETVKFIYQDNGADSLVNRAVCGDWAAFENSIEPNYMGERNFFQAIEKPAIYRGYTTYNAKLQKLVDEIGKRLKSSKSRAADPVRLRAVDSLQGSLLELALIPSSPLTVNAEGPPGDIAEEEISNNNVTAAPQEQAPEKQAQEDDQMDWTEVLQWLLLLLLVAGVAGLWVQNRNLKAELEQRMNRRKQEISAIQRMKESDKPEKAKTKAYNEPKINQTDVIRLIRAEIEKVRVQSRKQREQAAVKQDFAKPVEAFVPKPSEKEESQSPLPTESKMTKEEEKRISGLFFDKLPFKGGFHQNHLSSHRHPDSIYSILIGEQTPEEAQFWVTEDQDVQKYAMQNGLSFFEEACEYNQVGENPSRVRNIERGKLRKNGNLWQIEKKVKVSFE